MDKSEKRRLTKSDRPAPVDTEILIPEDQILISTTDAKGIITEVNDIFTKISGYSKEELTGASHNIIRHPDMPRIMFKIVWDHIKDKENVMAVVKNLAKDGKYYWVVTDFVTLVDADRNILGYTAYRKPVNEKVKEAIIPLYKALCAIEDLAGMESSERFLKNYLNDLDTTYDDMIEELVVKNYQTSEGLDPGKEPEKDIRKMSKKKKQSLFNKLFGVK
jgi:PAS domain S-box-containing protein